MADLVPNISKGAVAELARRVNANDPTNSVFTCRLWNAGSMTDATVRDYDTVAQIEADANAAESTNTGYSVKTLDQTGGITVTVDDTLDKVLVDVPDQTWTAVQAGGAITDASFNYDSDSTSGTTANEQPCTWHDFAITPDGSDITAQTPNGIFQAT